MERNRIAKMGQRTPKMVSKKRGINAKNGERTPKQRIQTKGK